MRVSVLVFASYADALGASDLSVEVGEPATVGDVLRAVQRLPGADRLPPSPLLALNQRYATAATPVIFGDEVALIPPVAGG